ncbi:MAG: GFA family protein [Pseudomonadota bacterium]
MTAQRPRTCRCACGATGFQTSGAALFRILCHCTICQRFNEADYADVVVYGAASVERPPANTVAFATYKPPPNVQRGKCAKCGQPAIEVFEAPLLPKLTIVPFAMHGDPAGLPAPCGHIFYDKRRADADDDLPKHEGFLRSQLAFGKHLLASRRAGR